MSAVKFPDSHWDRTPDEWLREVLKDADVESGKVEDATEEQREQAAAALVARAFEVGAYARNMAALPMLCGAARALVRGTKTPTMEKEFMAAGVTSGDPKDATEMQYAVAFGDVVARLAQHLVGLGHVDAGKLVAQAARLLASPPPNPFGERAGGAS